MMDGIAYAKPCVNMSQNVACFWVLRSCCMTDVMTELTLTFKRVYISVWNDLQYAEIRQKLNTSGACSNWPWCRLFHCDKQALGVCSVTLSLFTFGRSYCFENVLPLETVRFIWKLHVFNPSKPELFKYYLRIQSVPQREHHTSPLQRSVG
jgi:hypothetical protein